MSWIFVCYDRSDAAADATALSLSLRQEFSDDAVFTDVDNVGLGRNWRTVVREAMADAAVVLAVIGPNWELSDAIELELRTALEADVPIIPLFVRGATLDAHRGTLPPPLDELPYINGASLDYPSWKRDLEPVFAALHAIADNRVAAPGPAVAGATAPTTPDPARPTARPTGVVVDRSELQRAIGQVIPAVATAEDRPILRGILLDTGGEGLRLVATDSYRLALRDLDAVGGDRSSLDVVVEAGALHDAVNAIPPTATHVGLSRDDGGVSIDSGMTKHTVPTIPGEYPRYRQFLPESVPHVFEAGTHDLLHAVQQARTAASELTPVRLEFNHDTLHLRVETDGGGKATWDVPGRRRGSSFSVSLNPGFLADAVRGIVGETAVIGAVEPLAPVLVEGTSPGYRCMVMPVKAGDEA